MKKLVLVRYGEYENKHLTEQGMRTMILVAEKIKSFTQNRSVCIISANISRAIESAEILSKHLNLSHVQNFLELYAAEEEGVLPNLDSAIKIINSVGKKNDVVVTIISRKYIETLPNFILKGLGSQKTSETFLDRGVVLVIDYDTKTVSCLR